MGSIIGFFKTPAAGLIIFQIGFQLFHLAFQLDGAAAIMMEQILHKIVTREKGEGIQKHIGKNKVEIGIGITMGLGKLIEHKHKGNIGIDLETIIGLARKDGFGITMGSIQDKRKDKQGQIGKEGNGRGKTLEKSGRDGAHDSKNDIIGMLFIGGRMRIL